MLIKFLKNNKFFRKIIYQAANKRAKDVVSKIEPFLKKNNKILDIGPGTCNVPEILLEKNFNITLLDTHNLSFVNNIKPIIYDGNKIPYKNNKFDKTLILTVLHHTPNPEKILKAVSDMEI